MSELSADAAYDVVVYGATMPGIAAVRSLRAVASDGPSVLVVNPQREVGGIGCAGGQNFWDVRAWAPDGQSSLPQGGSFRRWYRTQGQAYNVDRMVETLRGELDRAGVDLRSYHDLTDVTVENGRIDSVTLAPLERRDGQTSVGESRVSVDADVFVDASESGRLARLADVPLTVGRADWGPDDRQMAASLMVLVGGIDWDRIRQATDAAGDRVYGTTVDPVEDKRLFWGGERSVTADAITEFREAFPRMDLKAINAAEHADGQFWINSLLIYDVDGRYDARERRQLPTGPERTPWDRDRAYERAVAAVEDSRFHTALRAFPGFGEAVPARDEDGSPRVGAELYLRETVHARDDRGFAVERRHVETAGEGPETGGDSELYDERIGLGYYWLDNNGYARTGPGNNGALDPADNPVYVPYSALTIDRRPNLLVPGYAARVSSQAWFELRVLPNLCVLGDGAGAVAAVALSNDADPGAFDGSAIDDLQNRLREDCDAILDKRTVREHTSAPQAHD
jgi:hypothetical protein